MNKFVYTPELIEERDKVCSPLPMGESVSLREVKVNTGYFMYHMLGMKPYLWQYRAYKELDKGSKRNIFCTSRQSLGKSTMIAIYALKQAFYNLSPHKSTSNRTRIGIISATDDQSKKLINDIRGLIYKGDDWVKMVTKGKVEKFFSSQLDNSKNAKNSQSIITFNNGCTISCYPPTNKVRGFTFTILIIDEMAFIEDDNFFYEIALPTISKTDGQLIITSTPKGMSGTFYELFDPNDEHEGNGFFRLWLDWTHIEDDKEKKRIEAIRDLYYATGREREFEQEYMALFTVDKDAFFDNEDVENGIDSSLSKLDSYDKPCDLGVDFGGLGHSKTIITISTIDDDNNIRLIWDYEYKDGDEINLVDDIIELHKRFKIQRVIADDCPEGKSYIESLENKGINVVRMSFRAEKIKKYIQFRSKLKQGKIKYYPNKKLITEMKQLEQIEGIRTTQIRKPSGGTDDFIDSFVMSTYFYIEDNNEIKFFTFDGVYNDKDND